MSTQDAGSFNDLAFFVSECGLRFIGSSGGANIRAAAVDRRAIPRQRHPVAAGQRPADPADGIHPSLS